MEHELNEVYTPKEVIISKILYLRGEKVMLDLHLAELYGVETRALKQAVRRNLDLFPEDFMFTLSESEVDQVVSQNVIPSKKHIGGSLPYAFTESGVAMLSSVLKSKRARDMNITIMRAFVALRKMLLNHAELELEIDQIKRKVAEQGQNLSLVFKYLDELIERKRNTDNRPRIGYKPLDAD